MDQIKYNPHLNEQELSELQAQEALIVQTKAAYVRDANRRNVLSENKPVTDWFQHVEDERSQGWQSAISTMNHVFGELRLHYSINANKRANNK